MKMAYDNAGRLEKATSYSDTSASTAVNEAKFSYTKLWQVEKVDQDHNGAVTLDGGGDPTGDTRRVSYTYDTQKIVDGQDDNYTRITQLTYPGPSAHSIDYGYDKGSVDSNAQVSRLMKISSATPAKVYAEYGYIGLGTFAVVDIPAIDVQLDRTASADGKRNAAGYTTGNAGIYPAFDRFGRVVRQVWLDGDYTTTGGGSPAPTKVSIVEQSYSYDRASNRLTSYDVRPGATLTPSFKYTYDELHRLDKAERGKWTPGSPGTFTLLNNSQDWTLDLLGNWSSVVNDLNGDGAYSPTTERDLRSHNGVNELTQRTLKGQGPGAADLVLDPITYDKSGNILDEQRQVGTSTSETTWEYVHDAWNRLVEVKVSGAPDITKAKYGYNALNWRITKQVDTDLSGSIDWKSVMYYSANWQLLEERIDSNADSTDNSRRQYVWGARYIDDIIHSRLDADIDGDFTDGGDKRYYHLTDVQFSTMALTNDASAIPTVLERVTYSAYGKARHHRFADLNGDGATSGLDLAILTGAWASPKVHIADLNRDGNVDGFDQAPLLSDWAAAQADGVLSLSSIGNIIGWDGYLFNAETEQYHVRHRVYEPVLGRWLQRDLMNYIDGGSLYLMALANPLTWFDPSGLASVDEWRFDRDDHGGPHLQKGNRRYRLPGLTPIEHCGVMPDPLTVRDLQEMLKDGKLQKALREVDDPIIREALERLGLVGKALTGKLGKKAAKELLKRIAKASPLLLLFIINDYAEGGAEYALANSLIPADLITELLNEAAGEMQEWFDDSHYNVMQERLRKAGFSDKEIDEEIRKYLYDEQLKRLDELDRELEVYM